MSDAEILLKTGVQFTYCMGFIKGLQASTKDEELKKRIDEFIKDLERIK